MYFGIWDCKYIQKNVVNCHICKKLLWIDPNKKSGLFGLKRAFIDSTKYKYKGKKNP